MLAPKPSQVARVLGGRDPGLEKQRDFVDRCEKVVRLLAKHYVVWHVRVNGMLVYNSLGDVMIVPAEYILDADLFNPELLYLAFQVFSVGGCSVQMSDGRTIHLTPAFKVVDPEGSE